MQPFLRDEVDIVVNPDGTIELANELGDVFLISESLYDDLKKGKNLRNLPKKIFEELTKGKIIQTSRYISDDEGKRITLLRIDKKIHRYKKICTNINKYLPVISVIFFFFGVFLAIATHCNYRACDATFFRFVMIIEISAVTHELAHICSGVALGIDISEFGVLVLAKYIPMPIGYYVKPRRDYNLISKQVNFYLAGIEANLIIFFILIVLSCLTTDLSAYATYRFSAWMEILVIVSNMLPVNKMDGDLALSSMFDCGNLPISEITRRILFTKEGKIKLKNSGDCCITAFFVFVYLCKILYYTILALSFVIPIVSLMMML